jgi:hypothetical protein
MMSTLYILQSTHRLENKMNRMSNDFHVVLLGKALSRLCQGLLQNLGHLGGQLKKERRKRMHAKAVRTCTQSQRDPCTQTASQWDQCAQSRLLTTDAQTCTQSECDPCTCTPSLCDPCTQSHNVIREPKHIPRNVFREIIPQTPNSWHHRDRDI